MNELATNLIGRHGKVMGQTPEGQAISAPVEIVAAWPAIVEMQPMLMVTIVDIENGSLADVPAQAVRLNVGPEQLPTAEELLAHEAADEANETAAQMDPGEAQRYDSEGVTTPEFLSDLLGLIGEHEITLPMINTWTPDERGEVERWFGSVHVGVGDDEEPTPKPEVLRGHFTDYKCADGQP